MADATELGHLSSQPRMLHIESNAANFGAQGIFYDPVQITTHLPPPPPPMPQSVALALLAELPLGQPPEPQTLPNPHRMAIAPNPLFVGRLDALQQIAALLKAGHAITAITGIGGVGKTQLATEVVHRYGRYFGGGVFWLRFADPGTIASEVADCGRRIGVFHDAEQLDLAVQMQRTQARWASALPCLLVFDNCEDEALLACWCPPTGGCRVLVTSRKQSAWRADLEVQRVALDVLERSDGAGLLQGLAARLSREEASQIAEALGGLPLALHLAGHFLARYATVTPMTYLSDLRSPDLLQHPSLVGRGVSGMPTEREPDVARTFALSYVRLAEDGPANGLALGLLARAAWLALGGAFPRALLAATLEPPDDDGLHELNLTDALARLADLGLLEQTADGVLSLHRLIGVYVRQVSGDSAAQGLVERVVLAAAQDAHAGSTLAPLGKLLPLLCTLADTALSSTRPNAAALCAWLAACLCRLGAYRQAQPYVERALAIREQTLGSDHPDTAASMDDLARVLCAQGHHDTARQLHRGALAIRQRTLGPDHADVAASLNNLAHLEQSQGDDEQARPLYERALAIYQRTRGIKHPDTLVVLANLAGLLERQGQVALALTLYQRTLAIHERALGAQHADIAIICNNLACVLERQGEHAAARRLYQRALDHFAGTLGSEHPNTLVCLCNLARFRANRADLSGAIALLEQALAVRQRVLGPDHAETAQTVQELAWLRLQLPQAAAALAAVLAPLLQAIADAATGRPSLRPGVELALVQLEADGVCLRAAVRQIWRGERDLRRLADGLGCQERILLEHILALMF